MSVIPFKEIKAGEELFTFYGYTEGEFPIDFPWYFETKRKIEQEERLAGLEEKKKKQKKKSKADKKAKAAKNEASSTKKWTTSCDMFWLGL